MSETIYPAIGVTDASVDRDGHWMLARVFAKLHILDLDQHRELGPELLAVTGHDHGLIEVVQSDGTCWVVTAERVSRWATSDPNPVLFPLPMRPSSTILEDRGVLFDSGDSITVVRANKVTTIAHGSEHLAWDRGSTVATIDAAQAPSVVDLATGLGHTLPTLAQHVVVHGDAVLVGSTTEAALWKVEVPRDPLALDAWLVAVTNAKTAEGSEAYTWP